jgi:hypothetical protein
MSETDYRTISKLIEEVVGDDTIAGVKLLEGLKFYFESQETSFSLVKEEFPRDSAPIMYQKIEGLSKEAQKAMDNYTNRLKKENLKFAKRKTKDCATSS